MGRSLLGWKPLLVVAAAAAIVVGVGAPGVGAVNPVQSPSGCNADNSQVNIARSMAAAAAGQTVTFTVSAGNPATADGCDITGRSMKLTLPNGVSQTFGPFDYPNPSAIVVVGSLNYVTSLADLSGGKWNANVTWDGIQKDGFDSPSTGFKETSVTPLLPATTLSVQTAAPAKVHAGASVHVVVRETNSGKVALHDVTVTGTPAACASFTPVGVFSGNLAVGAFQDFECTFTAGAAGTDTAWSADGHGLDLSNSQVPSTGEHQEGSTHSINPKTYLTIVGTPPVTVHAGDSVTITVREKNTGDDTLSGVSVTGGPCASWTSVSAFGGTLAPAASQDFSCTFVAVAGANAWFADGKGTDSLGTAAPSSGEHQEGSVQAINPKTALTIVGTPPTVVSAGTSVTITVNEANTGNDTLTAVSVTGAPCATWTPTAAFAGTLAPGASQSFSCTFTVNGTVNWSADGKGTDSLGVAAPAAGEHQSGSVTLPPPPPPAAPKTDLAITKSATAQVTLSGGKATITYDMKVTNNGPDAATAVTVSDPAPSGVTFAAVTQQPGQGSCSVASAGAVLNCTIGTLAVGQSVSFQVTGTVTATGTMTNCATTVTTTPETNASNNQACASTVVVAPVTPPTPAPKPKPAPEICNTVTVAPKVLKGNGKTQRIVIKVTQGNKAVAGAKIKVTGPGISKTATSGKDGRATVSFKPGKPGIVRIEIQNKKACNSQRIGVVGVFEPPVTG